MRQRFRICCDRSAERHTGGTRGVSEPVKSPKHDDAKDDDSEKAAGESKCCPFAVGTWSFQHLPCDQRDEHGADQNARMLGCEEQTCCQADDEQADERWPGSESVERPDSGDKETGHSDIGGYKGRVCENVGIKDHQSESNKTGRVAKPLPSRQKHNEAQSESKQLRAHPHLEDEMLSVSV